MSSKYKEILIMTFFLCLAAASAAFALRPLVFRAEKTREIRAGVRTFTNNREKTELEKALDELHASEQNIKPEEKRAYPLSTLSLPNCWQKRKRPTLNTAKQGMK